MATGGTAPPLIMASHSHSLLDQDSTVSSPLSSPQAEAHDAEEVEDLDVKSTPSYDGDLEKPILPRADSPTNGTHEESDLSDLETNDSEAETERLYDTPRKLNGQSANTLPIADTHYKVPEKNTRTLQISPSKLQVHLRADGAADSGEDDNDEPPQSSRAQSDDSSTARKRKRSSPLRLDQTEAQGPARKRSGSILDATAETSSLCKLGELTSEKSAEHSGDDEDGENLATKMAEAVVKIAPVRAKSKRSHQKKRKQSEDSIPDQAQDPEGHIPDEEHPLEDEPIATAEVDEEAKHEEECKGKIVPFD